MTVKTRRSFLKNLAAISAFPAIQTFLSCSGADGADRNFRTSLRLLLEKVARDGAESIRTAANLAADTLISRNRCFIRTGYDAIDGFAAETKEGLSRLFIPLRSAGMAETVRPEDVVLMAAADSIVRRALETGARAIVLGAPSADDIVPADAPMVSTGLPDDGLLPGTRTPERPRLPGRAAVLAAVVSALAAEIYQRSGGIGRTDESAPVTFRSCMDAFTGRIAALESQNGDLLSAGKVAAESVEAGGKIVVMSGDGLLKEELNGPDAPDFAVHAGTSPAGISVAGGKDTVLLLSRTSGSRTDMLTKQELEERTESIIPVCPRDGEGGFRLYRVVPAALDNLSPEPDGAASFDGGTRRFVHTGSFMNAVLAWSIIEEALLILEPGGSER